MSYKIALFSAFIGKPGAKELKITEECREQLKAYGVDLYLFNGENEAALEPFYVLEPILKPNRQTKKRNKIVDIINRFRFRQFMYPSAEANHNRLIAKLPKMQFYKLVDKPYDYYVWLDSKFTLQKGWLDALLDLIEKYGNHELVLCAHSERNSIKEEFNYMKYYMRKKSANLCSKYVLKEMYYQVSDYLSDPDFVDDSLYECGFLLYSKNMVLQHKNFLDAWYAHNYYYTIQDQLSMPYLLKKLGVDVYPLNKKVFELEGTLYGYQS